ncbi:MAG: hypothetical protein GF346_05600 [Candidatus Eisenbacteria bacterium]|nr:hypothetical protein [Candidatus Latescibacterota bacterium]MBD3301903.1 hypothetical protein [Candidatus Eisenbacteria bacterium]
MMLFRTPRHVWIRRILVPLLVGGFVLPGGIVSGADRSRPFEFDLLFPSSTEGRVPATGVVGPEIAPALERPIDPDTYPMVPGDLLQLEVGGETDQAWRIAVSAEGKLLLPGADAVRATGRVLAEVDSLVRDRLAPRYPGGSIALHLLQPGSFRVPITGAVRNPSLQIFRSYDRVAFALEAAGGPRGDASLRAIRIRDASTGTETTADLVRFALLGELDQNPPLRPGVAIHVPPAEAYVEVSGAVHGIPGDQGGAVPNVGSRIPEPPHLLLEWKEGDTIGFALARAGGLSEEATGGIVRVREGERSRLRTPEDDGTLLRPGDRLEVGVRERYVYVIGAVRYPGPYAHLPELTAGDYVRMAGGPTQIGRGGGWKVRFPDGGETDDIGPGSYLPPGTTVTVPERWTHRVSTLLAPISGITALVISLVALRRD